MNVTKVYHKVFDTCTRCPNCREHDEGERCHAPVEGDPRKNADRINRGWLIGEKIPDWCPLLSPGSLPAADEEAIGQLRFGIADGLWAMKINEGTEKAVFLKKRLEAALSHLRSRLARLADAEPLLKVAEEMDPEKRFVEDLIEAALRYREKVKEGK